MNAGPINMLQHIELSPAISEKRFCSRRREHLKVRSGK